MTEKGKAVYPKRSSTHTEDSYCLKKYSNLRRALNL